MTTTTTKERQSAELVGISQIASRLGVHRLTAAKYMAELEVAGLVPGHIGNNHGKRWFWTDVLAGLKAWRAAT